VDGSPVGTLGRLIVLNCAIRNGDAHLKNFGILYSDAQGRATLAPVYDLITTTAYLANDVMALSLAGSKRWPDSRRLIQLGQTRADLGISAIQKCFEETADAITDVAKDVEQYFRGRSKYPDIGTRMLAAWRAGVSQSLNLRG
jgi:serine/threonine-protein kinase HipA